MPDPNAMLEVRDLKVRAGNADLVKGVSFDLPAGRIVALVGASGSGKTMTARACLGLVRARPGVVAGSVRVIADGTVHAPYEYKGRRAVEAAFQAVRGPLVGYLPQEARASLDPLWSVGRQVQEVVELRSNGAVAEPVAHWLHLAGFAHPAQVESLFPHELSGGMAQRACIALALARGSRFLVADEPTTGLDPTVQKGILDQVRHLRERGIGVLFITHDLRLVPRLADTLLVMHEGRIVDRQDAEQLHDSPSPHTQRLLQATARVAGGVL